MENERRCVACCLLTVLSTPAVSLALPHLLYCLIVAAVFVAFQAPAGACSSWCRLRDSERFDALMVTLMAGQRPAPPFADGFPRLQQGTETRGGATIRVSVTTAVNVSCAAFRHHPIDFTSLLLPENAGPPSADVIVGNLILQVRGCAVW